MVEAVKKANQFLSQYDTEKDAERTRLEQEAAAAAAAAAEHERVQREEAAATAAAAAAAVAAQECIRIESERAAAAAAAAAAEQERILREQAATAAAAAAADERERVRLAQAAAAAAAAAADRERARREQESAAAAAAAAAAAERERVRLAAEDARNRAAAEQRLRIRQQEAAARQAALAAATAAAAERKRKEGLLAAGGGGGGGSPATPIVPRDTSNIAVKATIDRVTAHLERKHIPFEQAWRLIERDQIPMSDREKADVTARYSTDQAGFLADIQKYAIDPPLLNSTAGLSACTEKCKAEVQAIIARCKAAGTKYVDPDWNPNTPEAEANMLYVTGTLVCMRAVLVLPFIMCAIVPLPTSLTYLATFPSKTCNYIIIN